MAITESPTKAWIYQSHARVIVAIACGLIAGFVDSLIGPKPTIILVGWDIAAAVYVLWIAFTAFRLDEKLTKELASSEDPDRATSDLIMVFASLASLAAVGMALVESGKAEGTEKLILVLTGVISVIVSWFLVHTAFALRYARLYYDDCDGGIDFNEDGPPDYRDFAYFSFTIGMTFQVSDTSISDKRIRRTVLHHAMLSYLFGTVIVATTINLVAGLSK